MTAAGSESIRMHRAGWIVADSRTIFRDGYLIEAAGQILDVGTGRPPSFSGGVADHGSGILFPGFVNPHNHLELSALRGRIPADKGFLGWVQELVSVRAGIPQERLVLEAIGAHDSAYRTGTVLVGDISSLGISEDIARNVAGRGVWFHEWLGVEKPPHAGFMPGRLHQQSIAAHAPHTTSPDLIRLAFASAICRLMPFSIHVAESVEEMECVTRVSGRFFDFLLSRGVDIRRWGLPARSPVAHLDRLGVLGENTVAVHVIHADDADMDLLSGSGTHVCICPRSNMYLHGRLPDVDGFLRHKVRVCIGTDSLASTPDLDLRNEIRFLARHMPDLPPNMLFRMATRNGADALGLFPQVGVLKPGARLPMAYADIRVSEKQDVIPAILFESASLRMVSNLDAE